MADRVVSYQFRGNFTQLTAGLTVAGRSVQGLSTKFTALDRDGAKMRRGLDQLGGTAGKFGLIAAAGLGAVVAASANFDSAMSKVDAATHESTRNLELLRAAAIDAGAKTVFSATQAADAVTALAKAGVSTTDILGGGLSGSLSLASAGELDVATAADIAATAMNQFGLQGKDIPHISDLLAAAAGKAQGEVSDMAQAFKFVGPVAHQMGISIEETSGTIAELASQGILADQAGTSLRGILTSLSSPSKIAAQEMKNLGINLYDAKGQFVGFSGVAGQLQQSLGHLSNAERDQALGRIFGNEQITAARILYAGGAADVKKWTEAVDADGFAADTAARKMNNLRGDFEQFSGSLQTLLITGGEGSQGPLRIILQDATKATNALNAMPAGAKNAASGLLAIVAITGGGLFLGAKVIKGITDTKLALSDLGTTGARVGATLRAGLTVTAVIAGLDVLDSTLDSILNRNFDQSKLSRSLDALSEGSITGELADKFGKDLNDFSSELDSAVAGGLTSFQRKLPDFIGDNPFDDAEGPKQAAKNIHEIDDALASLVESGQANQAAEIFERLKDAAIKGGSSVDDVQKAFSQYILSTKNLGGETADTTNAMDQNTVSMKQNAAAQTAAAKATAQNRGAMKDVGKQFIGLGKDVDNAKVSLTEWIKQLAAQAKALNDFRINAAKAGKNGVRDGLIKELQAAGPEGALRLQQLAHATKDQVRDANAAFASEQRAIQALVATVPEVIAVPIEVQGEKAAAASLRRLIALAGTLDVKVRADYIVNQQNAANKRGATDRPFAMGGYTGHGGKFEPAGIVHRGEFVFSAEATRGRERQLDALHRSLRGYANGGYVGAPTSAGGSGIDYQRLAVAMSNVRPLAGDITVMDGTNFRNTWQQLQRMASSDGVAR